MENSNAAFAMPDDIKKDDPFKYGMYLLNLKDSLKTYKEIENKTGINRHEVSHYIRIAAWSDEVKKFILENNISNTPILRAARTSGIYNNEEKLIEFLSQFANAEVKNKVRVLHPEFASKKIAEKFEEKKDIEKKTKKEKGKEPPKFKLSSKFFLYILLAVGGIILSFFILQQNYLFILNNIEKGAELTNLTFLGKTFNISLLSLFYAFVLEVILIMSAIICESVKNRVYQGISWAILAVVLIGEASFFGVGSEAKIVNSSSVVLNLEAQKNRILQQVESATTDSKRYEKTDQITKKRAVENEIKEFNQKIEEIDEKLQNKVKLTDSAQKIVIIYNAGVRILAMLMAVMIIHVLFILYRQDQKKMINAVA